MIKYDLILEKIKQANYEEFPKESPKFVEDIIESLCNEDEK